MLPTTVGKLNKLSVSMCTTQQWSCCALHITLAGAACTYIADWGDAWEGAWKQNRTGGLGTLPVS